MPTILWADPFPSGSIWPVTDAFAGGSEVMRLWTHRYEWLCAGVPLVMRVVAVAEQSLQPAEPSEPVAGALARLLAAHALPEALCCVENPAEALAGGRLPQAWGLRAMAIASAADEELWTQAWPLGILAHGWRDRLRISLHGRIDARSVLLALANGDVCSCQGEDLLELDESATGVCWQLRAPGTVTVFAAGGFELARFTGTSGAWQDQGNEGLVRLVIEVGGRSCWTQARLVRAGAGAR